MREINSVIRERESQDPSNEAEREWKDKRREEKMGDRIYPRKDKEKWTKGMDRAFMGP